MSMTMNEMPAPVLNDDAVLVILAHAGHSGAVVEYRDALQRDVVRFATVLVELVQRELVEYEDGEYFPTQLALDTAVEAETDRLRNLANARRARR